MNNSHQQQHYLNVYRRQLNDDLDAMGYGRRTSYESPEKSQTTRRNSMMGPLAAVTLMALGLLISQVV